MEAPHFTFPHVIHSAKMFLSFLYVHTLRHELLCFISLSLSLIAFHLNKYTLPEGPCHLLIYGVVLLTVIYGKSGNRGKRRHQKIYLQNF